MANKKVKTYKSPTPFILRMLLARRDSAFHTRTADLRRGSSRKIKHKSREY